MKSHKLEDVNKTANNKPTDQLVDVDKKDADDLLTCSEYAKDIFFYLRAREVTMKYGEDYLKEQKEIQAEHREKIIEWFYKVQMRYPIKDETIYIAVNILDRFLERKKISKGKLPLLGVVAILIAGKYEEIYPPHLRNYLSLLDKGFTVQDCIKMEVLVLSTLNYDLSTPSVLAFVGRYAKYMDLDKNKVKLAMYICEAQLLTTIMGKYEPSLLALSGLYLAVKASHEKFVLSETLLKDSKHTGDEVSGCSKDMLKNMLVKERIMLSNIRKKYAKCNDVVKIALNSIKV